MKTVLAYVLNAVASLALVLVTGAAVYASPILDAEVLRHESADQLNDEHNEQISYAHACHGQISCEIQSSIPPLRRSEARYYKSETFVMSLSKDRSIFAQQPEPPPPES